MSMKVTVRQLQEQLPDLLDRTVQSGEACIVQRNGKAVAVLVSLRQWRQQAQGRSRTPTTSAKEQERRVRVYQKKMKRLGPDYWLPAEEQARLTELVEKEDVGKSLTPAERRELRRLLKRHEQLMVKWAAALQAMG